MVDESNMSFRDDSRLINDQNNNFYAYEANQMRYVAFSRPTTTLVIYTKKTIGDDLIYQDKVISIKNETTNLNFDDLFMSQMIKE
jgi:hypothetical protein